MPRVLNMTPASQSLAEVDTSGGSNGGFKPLSALQAPARAVGSRIRSPLSLHMKAGRENSLDREEQSQDLTPLGLVGAAGLTGAFTGLAVALFKTSVAAVTAACYSGDGALVQWADQIFIPAAGGLAVAAIRLASRRDNIGPTLAEHVSEIERSVPAGWEYSAQRGAAAAVTLGTGNSMGPEGPSVEIGAAISRFVAAWAARPSMQLPTSTIKFLQKTGIENRRLQRQLLAAGAAAGVAAGFNAPLSGVFFALEVVSGSVSSAAICPTDGLDNAGDSADTTNTSSATLLNVMTPAQRAQLDVKSREAIAATTVSALVATVVVDQVLGNELALRPGEFTVQSQVVELPLSVGLGALSGGVALLFERASSLSRELFRRIEGDLDPRLAEAVRPVLGGLACGVIGASFPGILFFGYSTLNAILETGGIPAGNSEMLRAVSEDLSPAGVLQISDLIALLAAKLLATAVCVGSGLIGGTFAPSIFLGAVLGLTYQSVAGDALARLAGAIADFQTSIGVPVGSWGVIPQLTVADGPAYALIGAAATLASLFRAPLTASLLLFELTQKFEIILPLLAASGTGTLVVERFEEALSKEKVSRENYNNP